MLGEGYVARLPNGQLVTLENDFIESVALANMLSSLDGAASQDPESSSSTGSTEGMVEAFSVTLGSDDGEGEITLNRNGFDRLLARLNAVRGQTSDSGGVATNDSEGEALRGDTSSAQNPENAATQEDVQSTEETVPEQEIPDTTEPTTPGDEELPQEDPTAGSAGSKGTNQALSAVLEDLSAGIAGLAGWRLARPAPERTEPQAKVDRAALQQLVRRNALQGLRFWKRGASTGEH